MDATIDIPNNSTQDTSTPKEHRRSRNRQRHINGTAETSTEPRDNEVQSRQQRSRHPHKGDVGGQARSSPSSSRPEAESVAEGSQKRDHRLKHRQKYTKPRNNGIDAGQTKNEDNGQPSQPPSGTSRRGAKFGARLTDPQSVPVSKPRGKYRRNAAPSEPIGEDLTSRLIHDLRTPPYPDCPICFNPIHPAQTTWSCSPSTPVIRQPEDEGQEQQYCWTTFHVKCIGEWASTNVKAVADAWRARGDPHKKGDWRCPGCQAKREIVPSGYWCFCHSMSEPKPPRLATPHSCAGPCSRVRESGCGHPCPLECHPGPCPPCQVTTRLTCYCPQKKTMAFRCGERRSNLSCGGVCGRKLGCGNHTCQEICHDGPCPHCAVREQVKCWCGASTKEVGCGEGGDTHCIDANGMSWTGKYGSALATSNKKGKKRAVASAQEGIGEEPGGLHECDLVCGKMLSCGLHKCEERDHKGICPPCLRSSFEEVDGMRISSL
ncbi:hypothetical protein C0993_004457 [Termitomyces sp. T159_Od127]|nr:hypothetical protein C0993_004457 [Termitomyces sp. T159_Od127]